MKFKDYKYEKPNIEEISVSFYKLLNDFEKASSYEDANSAFTNIYELRTKVETNFSIASVRHTIDTTDSVYDEAQNIMDEIEPVFSGLIVEFYKALLQTKFRFELEKVHGKRIFEIAQLQINTFSPEVVEDMKIENKLVSQYQKLLSSAKIEFEGKTYNLSQLSSFTESKNRKTRKTASASYYQFFANNKSELDRIYDQLVKVRTQIAHKLGYENFIKLGYARMGRSDYDSEMVKNYRKQVYQDLVPYSQELRVRQAKRLDISNPKYYDFNLEFIDGNAKPKNDMDYLVDQAKIMYHEMSKETDEFFTLMLNRELMDLEAKKGKAGGGYCTSFPLYRSPFIFANFNGTSGDVDVLTHEVGHAFQYYCSSRFLISEYTFPTMESAEINSMSMEFFAYPWMKNFFEEQELKYKFSHLSSAITFIPYGVSVDEFQHFVYEHPNITPDERHAKWREIEKKYVPHKDYDHVEYLEKGCFWMRQSHIFSTPFYYIDYTIAQVCAFQFYALMIKNYDSAWKSYVDLCRLGGSQSFLQLLKSVGLKNPFQDGTIKEALLPLKEYLDNIEDSKL